MGMEVMGIAISATIAIIAIIEGTSNPNGIDSDLSKAQDH
jgi:hypothetical protein